MAVENSLSYSFGLNFLEVQIHFLSHLLCVNEVSTPVGDWRIGVIEDAMKFISVAVILLCLHICSICLSDEAKVENVLELGVIDVDRRPDKDLKYARCLVTAETGEIMRLVAVKTIGDRKCPDLKDSKIDVENLGRSKGERITTDDGNIVSQSTQLSNAEMRAKVEYKDKNWRFSFPPYKLTVKSPSMKDPKKNLEDTFFIARIISEDKEKKIIACEDASSLRACLDSPLEVKKPLAMRSADGQGHALARKSEGQRPINVNASHEF